MKKYLLFGFILISHRALSQALSSDGIDSIVENARKSFNVPGIAVAVIKDGKIIHAKGYGVRSLKTGLLVNENTLFGIASNSKAFTAFALGMLVDEGKISWDDKVRKWIPEFKLYSSYVSENFTIRDLLTHRSGLGLGAGDLMFFPDSSNFGTKDIIYNLRYLKQTSGFRTKFDYDNILYIVAGEVVKRVSGQTWDDFVESRIMRPISMNRSATSYGGIRDKSNVIDAHTEIEGSVQIVARSMSKVDHPAGGIYSSIADLSKWVLLLLNNGIYGDDSVRIFSQDVQKEIWSPQTIISVNEPGYYNTHFKSYGMGFFIKDVKGYKQLDHTGGQEGMVSQITMIPELNLGIIVLTNQEERAAYNSITSEIRDGYLGLPTYDWVRELKKDRMEELAEAKEITDPILEEIHRYIAHPPIIDFSIFAGDYRDPWFGDVSISIKNRKYWFESKRSPKLSGEMIPYKKNSFMVKWQDHSMNADAFVMYSLNKYGKATSMKMKPISPLTDFSYDFQDLDFKRLP